MSVGQAVGGIAGAVVGFFVGGPSGAIYGAQIGIMAGGAIDPPKGPKIVGPKLSDLSVQLTGFSNPIPRVYGSIATMGTIFWVENNALTPHTKTTSQGGKGGGSKTETETTTYSATFAVGLCKGPIDGIGRIWITGKLVYDGTSTNASAILASGEAALKFTLYTGTDTQLPDPRMQATLGVANTPAWRGLAYLVIEDLDLTNYGNSLMGAQIKVEILKTTTSAVQSNTVATLASGTRPDPYSANKIDILSMTLGESAASYVSIEYVAYGTMPVEMNWGSIEYLVNDSQSHDVPYGLGYTGAMPTIVQSNADRVLSVHTQYSEQPQVKFKRYYPGGTQTSLNWLTQSKLEFGGDGLAAFDGEIIYYLASATSASYLVQLDIDAGVVVATASRYMLISFGYSDNYIFAMANTDSSFQTTIYKFSRLDLSLVATWTQTANGGAKASIFVVDDSTFYTAGTWSGNHLYKWVDGVVVRDFGNILPEITPPAWFAVFSDDPLRAVIQAPYNLGLSSSPRNIQMITEALVSTPAQLADIIEAECLSSGLLSAGDIDTSAIDQAVRGYKVTQNAAIRASLEPLQAAWPFDVFQSGYKVYFVPRGGSPVATIDIGELGAIAGSDKAAIRITNSREMDTQIPRRVELTYIDVTREYDVNEQSAERLNTDAINTLRIELPIVLNADEAAGKAEVLLYLYWLERNDISFVLPPTYDHLQPADVVTINADSATYQVRLVNTNILPDGRVECAGKYNNSAIYTPTAVGSEGAVIGQTLAIQGSSALALLDIPCVNSTYMNEPGLLTGMSGYLSSWQGGTLVRSADSGQTWQSVQGFLAPGMTSGWATTALATGVTHIVDATNSVNVNLDFGTLASVSGAALANGANHFALGAHGRWEIIAARTVFQESDGSYTLSNLLRGRFGTEQFMATHAARDQIILLDTSVLRFVSMALADINLTRLYRPVTNGKTIDSAAEYQLAYLAENLECRSPINLNGSRNPATLDWSLSWTRRSRLPVEPFSGLATPLGETSEAYEVEIWDSSYTTLKRTFTALTSAAVSYTSAQQVTDFGVELATLYVKVYQLSSTMGRGWPLVSSIYRNISADPFSDNVKLLLHLSTDWSDFKGHTLTTYNGPTITGGYAVFDGVDDYAALDGAADLFPGNGDFTHELRVMPLALTKPIFLRDDRPAGNGIYLCFYINTNGSIDMYVNSSVVITTSAGLISINNEYHIAVCRASGSTRLFVNGTQAGSTYSDSNNYLSGASRPFIIGNGGDPTNPAHRGNAKFRDIRYTAAGRYTANFTAPASPLPDPT